MNTHGHDNHDKNQELVESSGINAKPILIFMGALAVATAMVFVIIKGMEYGFKKVDELDPKQPATQMAGIQKLPPEPRLQGAPEPNPDNPGQIRPSLLPLDDMKTYRERIDKEAADYQWVDKQGGVARIPIERAKEMIAEKGLPSLSDTAIKQIQSAENVRREIYNSDSSAGRRIKGEQPMVSPQAAEQAPTPAAGTITPAGQAKNESLFPKVITPVRPAAGKQ